MSCKNSLYQSNIAIFYLFIHLFIKISTGEIQDIHIDNRNIVENSEEMQIYFWKANIMPVQRVFI